MFLIAFLVALVAGSRTKLRRRWPWSKKPAADMLGNYQPGKYGDTDAKINKMKFLYFNKNHAWGSPGDMTSFRAGKPTKVVTHGYTDTHKFCKGFVEAWSKLDVNVICVDWSAAAAMSNSIWRWFNPYDKAATHSQFAGIKTAKEMIKLYKKYGGGKGQEFFGKMHIIGHSLGGHHVGRAGRTIKKLSGFTVDRITGLDPAGPGFFPSKDGRGAGRGKLRKTDASFVDVIHSNGALMSPGVPRGMYGHLRPMGHVGFYPGGGSWMPGCPHSAITSALSGNCSHQKAPKYFIESINNPNAFKTYKCSTKKNTHSCYAMDAKAFGSMTATNVKMGNPAGDDRSVRGYFWVDVNPKAPYGKNRRRRLPRRSML